MRSTRLQQCYHQRTVFFLAMTPALTLAMIRRRCQGGFPVGLKDFEHGTSIVRINHPGLIRLFGQCGGRALWTLFRTVKVIVHTERVNPYHCSDEQRYLYSVWHDSMLMAAFGGKHRGMVALASRHRDGRIGASLAAGVGVKAVQGSSGPSGRTAVRKLIKLAATHDVVITPDGPRGPRRTMSRGIAFLSAKTGNAIVPTAFHCNRAWEVRGRWTNLTVPKPFSQVNLSVGTPINVPAAATECELEEYVHTVQEAMDYLQSQVNSRIEREGNSRAAAVLRYFNKAA